MTFLVSLVQIKTADIMLRVEWLKSLNGAKLVSMHLCHFAQHHELQDVRGSVPPVSCFTYLEIASWAAYAVDDILASGNNC